MDGWMDVKCLGLGSRYVPWGCGFTSRTESRC